MVITPILTENITPNVPPDVSYKISPQEQALLLQPDVSSIARHLWVISL
jgi:hypothetical protein